MKSTEQAFKTMDQISAWGKANASGSFSAMLLAKSERWPFQPVTIQYAVQPRLMDQDEIWQSEMGGAL
jgi:hypothetical protein